MNLANRITLLRILMIPAFLFCAFLDWPYALYLSAVIFILAAISDLIDGHIARSLKQITVFGTFIDPIADKLLIVAALIVLLPIGRLSQVAMFIVVAREFIITGLRLVAASEGRVIAADWLGKLKTLSQNIFIVAALIDNWPVRLFATWPIYQVLEWIMVLLTLWSGIDYLVRNWDVLDINGARKKEQE